MSEDEFRPYGERTKGCYVSTFRDKEALKVIVNFHKTSAVTNNNPNGMVFVAELSPEQATALRNLLDSSLADLRKAVGL